MPISHHPFRLSTLVIFTLFMAVFAIAANAEPSAKHPLWQTLHQQFDQLQQQMRPPADARAHVTRLLNQQCSADWHNRAEVAAKRAQARHLDSHNGIKLNAGYTSAALNNGAERDTGNSYVELSWDLLKNGWQDYNYRALDKRREAEISRIQGQMRRQLHQARCRRFNMDSRFSTLSARLYTGKLVLLEPQVRAGKQNYLNGHTYLDDYLELESQLSNTRTRLQQLSQNSQLDSQPAVNLPILDINLDAISQAVRNDPRQLELEHLRHARVQEQNRFRDGTQLRVFLRQNLATDNNNDDGLAAAVRVSVPLHKGEHDHRPYLHEQLAEDASLERWERRTQVRVRQQSFAEQLERTLDQQYRYLRSLERARRTLTRHQLGQRADLALAATQMNTLFDAAIELNEAKEILYRRINEVFLVAGIPFAAHYLTQLHLPNQQDRARAGTRSLYLWSERFNTLTNQELIAFLKARQIEHLLLSVGRNTATDKARELVRSAAQQGIRVSALLGDASWVKPGKATSAVLRIAAAYELSDDVHLDIEPHTLAGYSAHQAQYLRQYLALLDEVRNYAGYGRLSVSVPLHWPAHIYRSLSGKVDQIYLMAYDQPSAQLRLKKIKQVLTYLKPGQAVIALDVTEFSTPAQLDDEIRQLSNATGVQQFALHALDDLLAMTLEAQP